ncbi:MAG: cadmium-translocating P-type ATPase [Bacteroidia bacterium]|nr:cadmium-translocating P-type ATPase [Bacteroidia bacterium]
MNQTHKHTYDAQGRMTCCTQEEKINAETGQPDLLKAGSGHTHAPGEEDHDHEHGTPGRFRTYIPSILSFVLLISGILADQHIKPAFFTGYIRLAWYLAAYIPVGFPVLRDAWKALRERSFFTEFTLMSIATGGAFVIGEYPEGVAVMLFYAVGELFQSAAVNRAKSNIRALLDVRPALASVLRNGSYLDTAPGEVQPGETIRVKAGEKVPLDGEMLSPFSRFDTSALSGESRPRTIRQGEQVLAGMLNLDNLTELRVTRPYADSSLARILDMVQNANSRKARTELLIRRFARIYTPVVFLLALGIALLPWFFAETYIPREWVYRALVFLVISCPCALVISIPLGYFGGIGAASRHGILFKGSNYLDLITRVNTVVMDKTGTLTRGVFSVQQIHSPELPEAEFMKVLASLEQNSTHPVAKAVISALPKNTPLYDTREVQEIAGHGLSGLVNGRQVLAGNSRLLRRYDVPYDTAIDELTDSIVVVAVDGRYAGYVRIADQVKDDAAAAVQGLKENGVQQLVMLSGDKAAITQKIAAELGITEAYGDLLPEDKVARVEALKKDRSRVIAFAGDGINDAPVLALSDIGIAMGAMGSDAAIETADVVIQTDQPSRIVSAIQIGRATRRVVIQNIVLAFAVKILVLALGAGGIATMWEAVFADVGVALLAILNAVRILRMKF